MLVPSSARNRATDSSAFSESRDRLTDAGSLSESRDRLTDAGSLSESVSFCLSVSLCPARQQNTQLHRYKATKPEHVPWYVRRKIKSTDHRFLQPPPPFKTKQNKTIDYIGVVWGGGGGITGGWGAWMDARVGRFVCLLALGGGEGGGLCYRPDGGGIVFRFFFILTKSTRRSVNDKVGTHGTRSDRNALPLLQWK